MHATGLILPAPPGTEAPALSPAPAPAPLPINRPPLRARDLSLALLGLLSLGAAAALGLPAGSAALRLTPSVVLVDLAALALTAPALIAVHQFLRLAAQPEQLAAALGRALIHGGRVAFGLSVVVLFFSATTNLALVLLIASLLAVGVFTSATACVELTAAERAAAHTTKPSFTLLLLSWIALGWMIALRVGLDVASWVLGFQGGF